MNIAGMRARIIFQKSIVKIDEIGNHTNEWANFYSCWAGIKNSGRGGRSTSEKHEAAQTLEQKRLDFTVRYCEKISEINSTEYRIYFNEQIYNIEASDIMKFDKKSLNFTAVLVSR